MSYHRCLLSQATNLSVLVNISEADACDPGWRFILCSVIYLPSLELHAQWLSFFLSSKEMSVTVVLLCDAYVSQGFSFVNYMAKGHTLNNTFKYLSFIPNCATHSCLQVKLSAHSRESKTIKAVKKQTPDWCIGLQENNLAIAKSITEISNPVCYLKVATWLPWHRAKWPFGRVRWTFLKHGTKMWVFLK